MTMVRGRRGIVLMTSVLVLMPSLCLTSSDPMAYLCGSVCWEEEALSDQCVQDRCSALRGRRRAYRNCEDRCWDLVAPCRLMCVEEAPRVLDTCDRNCTERPPAADATAPTVPPGCHEDCFTHNMMLIKARVLPPIDPNLRQQLSQAS